MSYIEIAILAIVQGAAELLPVSSSAHVIVAERLMGHDPSRPELTFLLVMLHTGTMGAVLCYFWRRWHERFRQRVHSGSNAWHLPAMVVLATAVTVILGFALKALIERAFLADAGASPDSEIEALFKNLPLIAASLGAVGVFMIVSGCRRPTAPVERITPPTALLIGLVQGLCLPFRGFSRSGATISAGLCRGLSRRLAEDFSFALVVLLTPGVILWELRRLVKHGDLASGSGLREPLVQGLVGMVLSFVAGLLALRVLSAVLERGGWKYFGYYCVVAAGAVWAVDHFGIHF